MRAEAKIAEFPVTEWRGVTVTIRIDHPDAKDSMSYRVIEDSRLLPFGRIRRPLDNDHFAVMEYVKARNERAERARMLADKIAHSILHALERVDDQ